MATKKYNVQYFSAVINGEEIRFRCYTTSTRCGFCHTAVSLDYGYCDTKISYYNRTWERFDYESVLNRAIEKYPKSMQAELREQIIERKAKAEHEKCEAFIGAFQNLYNGLSDENKEILKEKTPTIETEEQAEAVMGVMKLMTILG